MKTKTIPSLLTQFVALGLLLIPALVNAAAVAKQDNTNALGLGTSWVGGTAPGPADIATWSGTYTADAAGTNSLRAVASGFAVGWQGMSIGTLTGPALTTNTIFAAVTNLSGATEVGNLVTFTTKANHAFAPGQSVTIAGVTPSGYNGTFTVLGVPAATTFTCTNTTTGLAVATAFGTVESAIYIGGLGAAIAASTITNGTSGIDLSAASHSVNLNAVQFSFSGNQTWNTAAGRLIHFGASGTGGANAKCITSGADGLIDISGSGVADMNQGGASGFADVAGFAGFAGRWRVNAGATLRGLRNGGTAWGTNISADAITLNGGTLAVGGISGDVGNWTWNTPITLAAGTSFMDDQNVAGTGRYVKLNLDLSGSGNLTFKESLLGATTYTDPNLGFIITGTNNTMSGTITIGGPAQNGVAGRLTFVRVGGINASVNTTTTAGPDGSLGTASVVNNGVLTFAWTESHTVSNALSGTGSVRIGGTLAGTDGQNVTFSGAKTYSGDTTIGRGTLTLDATGSIGNSSNIFLTPAAGFSATIDASAAGFTLNGGQRLVGAATGISQNILGNVTAASGSVIVPGGSNTIGTLTFNNDLALSGGARIFADLGVTSDAITVGGSLSPSGVTTLQVTNSGPLANGIYPLINVTGTLNGATNNFAVAGPVTGGRSQTFSVLYTNNSVAIVVGGAAAANLVWKGDNVSNVWSTNLAVLNWTNTDFSAPDAFYTGDFVSFDDSGSTSPDVNITATVLPGSVSVNSANNYRFAGVGGIGGSSSLTKDGAGTLTLAGTNSYTGTTFINAGVLAVTNGNAIPDSGAVSLVGGTFQVQASETINSITNPAGTTIDVVVGNLTYTNGSMLGTLTNSGTVTRYNAADTAQGQFTTADALAFNGKLVLRGASVSTAPGAMSPAGRYWLHSAGGSQLAGTKFALDTGDSLTNGQDVVFGDWDGTSLNRKLTLSSLTGYGTIRCDAGSDGVRALTVDQSANTTFNGMFLSHGGTAGQIRSGVFEKQGVGTLTMAGVVGQQTQSSSGTNAPLSVTVTAGKLVLQAADTYTGPTSVAALAALEINGVGQLGAGTYDQPIANNGTLTLNSAANQALNGPVSGTGVFVKTNTGTLFINGTFDQSSFVIGGGLLGGTGVVNTAVSLPARAGLAPGNGIGTLTISNALSLAANTTNYFEVDATNGVNDLVKDFTSAAYNGILVVSNLSGPGTITNGQSFQYFSAGGTGSFSSITPVPEVGLVWNFNAASGVLTAASGIASNPTNITFSASGGTLTLSWPADHLGWFLQSQTNSRAIGISNNWTDVAGSSTVTSVTNTVSPAAPTVFFRLRIP